MVVCASWSEAHFHFRDVQEILPNRETRKFANVVLPGASFFEKSGTFTNGERRVQRVNEVIPPLAGTKTDGQIVVDIMNRMGIPQPKAIYFPPALVPFLLPPWKARIQARPRITNRVEFSRIARPQSVISLPPRVDPGHPRRAMKRTLISVAFLIALTASRADLVIDQKIEGAGQNGAMMILKIRNSKLRVDVQTPAGAVSSIIDLDSGESLTLTHAQKTALKMSAAQTKGTLDAIRMKEGTADVAKTKPEATGRMEKLGAWNTEVFTSKIANGVQTLWVTKDLPNFAEVKEQLDKLNKWSAPPVQKGASPDTTWLPGVVVKTETEASGQKHTSTVLSVKEEDLDAALFDVPEDYRTTTIAGPPPPPVAPPPAK